MSDGESAPQSGGLGGLVEEKWRQNGHCVGTAGDVGTPVKEAINASKRTTAQTDSSHIHSLQLTHFTLNGGLW